MGRRLPTGNSDILTPDQVAALVGRHRETVTLALRKKELKGKQRSVGGFWYIRREDALAWAAGQTDSPAGPSAVGGKDDRAPSADSGSRGGSGKRVHHQSPSEGESIRTPRAVKPRETESSATCRVRLTVACVVSVASNELGTHTTKPLYNKEFSVEVPIACDTYDSCDTTTHVGINVHPHVQLIVSVR